MQLYIGRHSFCTMIWTCSHSTFVFRLFLFLTSRIYTTRNTKNKNNNYYNYSYKYYYKHVLYTAMWPRDSEAVEEKRKEADIHTERN